MGIVLVVAWLRGEILICKTLLIPITLLPLIILCMITGYSISSVSLLTTRWVGVVVIWVTPWIPIGSIISRCLRQVNICALSITTMPLLD